MKVKNECQWTWWQKNGNIKEAPCALQIPYPICRKHDCFASRCLGLRLTLHRGGCLLPLLLSSELSKRFHEGRPNCDRCRMGMFHGLFLSQAVSLSILSLANGSSCPDLRNTPKCLWHVEGGRDRSWRRNTADICWCWEPTCATGVCTMWLLQGSQEEPELIERCLLFLKKRSVAFYLFSRA